MATLIPAAQYLRMSTEHQQYSLANQAAAIAHYAADHSFQIVKTYSDAAKSGLRLKNRSGLKALFTDIIAGHADFRAVLVYDVSRLGRFQDIDEAAHYEYICRSAGVAIHYCAEMFGNDNSLSGAMLKILKRLMAGEYSRELSVKVKTGLVRLAKLGYKMGGSAPYGLRRQLLDIEGRPKQRLEPGEHKNLADEHVTFVPGPREELAIIGRIFREFADDHRSPNSICDRLNREGVFYLEGATWKPNTVRILLQNPHYIGMQVWGRTTAFLSGPVKRLPFSRWVVCPNAFEPIIPLALFLRAQQRFADFTIRLSDEQLLDRLRDLYKVHGYLSGDLIDKSPLCPALATYQKRFGGVLNVYARLEYKPSGERSYASLRQKGWLLRSSLLRNILAAFPNDIEDARRGNRFRLWLRHRSTGFLISVVFARYCPGPHQPSWMVETRRSERQCTTLLALVDQCGTGIHSLWAVPQIPVQYRHLRVYEDATWLRAGVCLENLSDLLVAIARFAQDKHNRCTAW